MTITKIHRAASALLAALLCSLPSTSIAQESAQGAVHGTAPPESEALVRRDVRGFASVALRPDVVWREYDKVMISEVQVAFSRTWDSRAYGRFGLEPRTVAKIRDELGADTRQAFAEVLTRGGYTVVSEAGAGVLQVVPQIVDLYVNAPSRDDLNPLHTYVLESGEMTLVLELRDSVTGTLLGRIRDRYRDPGVGVFVPANDLTRQAENRRVLRGWADRLRAMLTETRDPG